jgi:hypothetical protein
VCLLKDEALAAVACCHEGDHAALQHRTAQLAALYGARTNLVLQSK